MILAEATAERTPSAARSSNLPLFRERLPRRPYCTDALGAGLRIRGAVAAAASRYVQPDPPAARTWLAFDVDRPGAAWDWDDVGRHAPAPNLIAENPESRHAHLLYGLDVPVRTAPDGRLAPLRYAAAVEAGLRARLGADGGFCGLVVQNPLHPIAWIVTEPRAALYDLDELADWVELDAGVGRRGGVPAVGLGRNVRLFDGVRTWAYRAIRRQGWPDVEAWHEAVAERARALNTSPEPLPATEVRATARSVARWTWRRMSPEGFSQAQAARGAMKGAGRRAVLLPRARELAAEGISEREIGRRLGVSQTTVNRWLQRAP